MTRVGTEHFEMMDRMVVRVRSGLESKSFICLIYIRLLNRTPHLLLSFLFLSVLGVAGFARLVHLSRTHNPAPAPVLVVRFAHIK